MGPRTVHFEGFHGVRLAADIWGDDAAAPVLFLHGGGQTRHAWGSTARRIAESGWRAVSLDLRGHGDSEWPADGDYSLTALPGDCVAVACQLGEPPVLIGASLGGLCAILAEGTTDDVVSCGLVIVDATYRADPGGVDRVKGFMDSGAGGFATLEDAATAIAAYTPNRKRSANPEGLKKVLRQRDDGRWYWHWDPRFLAARAAVPLTEQDALFERALVNVRVPTLLVRGMQSDVATPEGVRAFLEQVPRARFLEVGGAAHMVAGDRNDLFSDAVIEFLEHDV